MEEGEGGRGRGERGRMNRSDGFGWVRGGGSWRKEGWVRIRRG